MYSGPAMVRMVHLIFLQLWRAFSLKALRHEGDSASLSAETDRCWTAHVQVTRTERHAHRMSKVPLAWGEYTRLVFSGGVVQSGSKTLYEEASFRSDRYVIATYKRFIAIKVKWYPLLGRATSCDSVNTHCNNEIPNTTRKRKSDGMCSPTSCDRRRRYGYKRWA